MNMTTTYSTFIHQNNANHFQISKVFFKDLLTVIGCVTKAKGGNGHQLKTGLAGGFVWTQIFMVFYENGLSFNSILILEKNY